ncbi:TPA: hypothetical protein MYO72_002374 [Citrobacter freundii]|nr:hypothetical protein [Citrobacter freundii]HCB1516955.1 hypothetical protein [Citrobacter freundii]
MNAIYHAALRDFLNNNAFQEIMGGIGSRLSFELINDETFITCNDKGNYLRIPATAREIVDAINANEFEDQPGLVVALFAAMMLNPTATIEGLGIKEILSLLVEAYIAYMAASYCIGLVYENPAEQEDLPPGRYIFKSDSGDTLQVTQYMIRMGIRSNIDEVFNGLFDNEIEELSAKIDLLKSLSCNDLDDNYKINKTMTQMINASLTESIRMQSLFSPEDFVYYSEDTEE